jgi:osmotically-inducible protein OsmY
MPDVDCGDEHAPEARVPQGFRRTDAEIAREIAERLADDVGLDESAIEVEVRQGEVTLHGWVRQPADMPRAEAHACAVAGVSQVKNDLRAKQTTGEPPSPSAVGAAPKMGKPPYEL